MCDAGEATTASGLGARLLARAGAPRLRPDGPQIIAVDGWSGSAKTHVAGLLGPALGAPCVHLDDFVPGWHGLAASVDLLVEWVLEPVARGRPARWRRWDWQAGRWADRWETLAPPGLLIVEGCGAGSAPARPWLTSVVWVDAEADERVRRLRARADWPVYEPWAEVWSRQERDLRADDDVAAAADVVVRTVAPEGNVSLRAVWRM